MVILFCECFRPSIGTLSVTTCGLFSHQCGQEGHYGSAASCGRAGFLVSVAEGLGFLGLLLLVTWNSVAWSVRLGPIQLVPAMTGGLLIFGMLLTLWNSCLLTPVSRQMVVSSFGSETGIGVAASGAFLDASPMPFDGGVWGHAQDYGEDIGGLCQIVMSVPGVI